MLITYVFRPGVTGGSINPGDGSSYDLTVNMTAGGGQITVDTVATPTLAAALAASGALLVSGTAPGTPSYPDTIGPIYGHVAGPALPGDMLVRAADGYFAPTQSVLNINVPQTWRAKPVFSAGATLPVTPGANVEVARQGEPGFSPLTVPNCDLWLDAQNIANGVFAYDAFGRVNSASSLGTADSGLAWTTQTGIMGVNGNAAYMPSGAGASASLSTGVADSVMDAILAIPASGTSLTILYPRYVNSTNNIQVAVKQDHSAANSVQLLTDIAGTTTQIGFNGAAALPTSGPVAIRVIAKGNTYTVLVNGVAKLTAAADAGSNFLNSTAQAIGFASSDTATRITALSISACTPADGDTISAWPDVAQASVGGAMVQATVASRPIYRATGINGMPAIQFASSVLTSSYSATDKPVTVIAVINRSASGAQHAIVAGNGNGGLEFRCNSTNQLEALKQNTASIGASADIITQGVPLIVAMTYDANGTYNFYINGRPSGASLNAQSFTAGQTLNVGGVSAVGDPFNGYIGEIVKYSRVLYGTELRNVINGLAKKWGVTLPVRIGQGGYRTPLQALHRIRGANLSPAPVDYTNTPSDAWTSLWQNWNWAGWLKPSIDNAAALGANCIRLITDIAVVYSGTISQAMMNAQAQQLAAYLQTKGMSYYLCCGDLRHTAGAPASAINTMIGSLCSALTAYTGTIAAVEVSNEVAGAYSLYPEKAILAWVAQWAATVRANLPGVPITVSNVSSGTGGFNSIASSFGDYTRLQEWDPYLDFFDFHVYPSASMPVTAQDPTPYYVVCDKPLMLGEVGASRAIFTSSAAEQAAYQPIADMLTQNPQIIGANHWDIDSGNFGLYSAGAVQTDISSIYQQLPVTV